ncbi:MAG: hypothetical protein JST26_00180 [Bacteroidetes bacterium]|nr:hypothetical protein [Bacteroidota bacterium]
MKQAETLKILQKYIASNAITQVKDNPNIFRCHKDFNQQPYQILYVDCSDAWLKDSFSVKDLEAYQEHVLLNDYYKESGPLQWNFYYTFVSSSTEINRHSEKKKEIERDELYSRKQILSNQELDQWLSRINDLSKSSNSVVERDLSSVWINKLKSAKLDAVFLDITYKDGIDKFLNGKPEISSEKDDINIGSYSKEKVFSIDRLEIERYRNHPIQSEFNFGKVNLFKGINGSGKTSTLEAIELMLCGRTNRNAKSENVGVKLKAAFSGNPSLVPLAPYNHSIYKERDKAWYNNIDQKGNRMHISFNRFNFFNTDAASSLASDTNQNAVRSAFQDIALGSEVNTMESKLHGYYDRFESALKGYDKLVVEHEDTIHSQKKLTAELLEQDNSPEMFLKEIAKEAKAIKWDIGEKIWNNKTIVEQEKRISNSLTLIGTIEKILSWYNIIGYNSVEKGLNEHEQCLNEIKKIEDSIKTENKEFQKLSSELEAQSELEGDLDNLKEYFDEPKINQLKHLSFRISEQKELIDQLTKVTRLASKLDFIQIPENYRSLKINTIESKIKETINEKEADLKKLSEKRNKMEIGFSQLEKLVAEIKSRGKEFLKLNPDHNECPLCYTIFPKNELIKSIENGRKTIKSSGVLDDVLIEISTLKKQIKQETVILSALEEIKQVGELIHSDKVGTKSPNTLEKEIKSTAEALRIETNQLTKLIELQTFFKDKGLTEKKFETYMRELDSWGVEIKDKKGYDRLYAEVKGNVVKLKKRVGILDKSIKALERKLKETFSVLGIEGRDQKVVLERRISNLTDARKYFLEMDKYVNIKANEKLSVIQSGIEKLKKLITTYKKILLEKEEHDSRIANAESRIKHAQKELALIKPKRKRAADAMKVIGDIFKNHSKEAFLEKFIEQNKKEISEIFKVIHSPKEFDQLVFDTNGNIELMRSGQVKPATLTEISTGQRSALALSIFSALNRKLKNGPNILLFDDPVTNIDDLNILSYFDYLREVVINGGRQIFFATANENIAFLFTQKFQFLGNDQFKTFEFRR